jgi:hypothetical protein
MFKQTAIAAGLGLVVSVSAQADYDPYQFEVNGALTGGDVKTITLGGTWYFDDIDEEEGPYGEAAFIDAESSVSASYTDGETDSDDVPDLDISTASISTRLIFGEGNWIVDLGYDYSEPELADGPDNFDTEVDVITGGVGKYIFDKTTLVFSYIYTDVSVDTDDFGEFEGDVDSYRVDLDHLWVFENDGGVQVHAAYGFVDVENRDDIDIYEIDGTWYLNRSLGFGAGYRNTDDDGLELEEYGAFVEYFISPSVAVTLEYNEGEIEDTDIDTDSYLVGITARF